MKIKILLFAVFFSIIIVFANKKAEAAELSIGPKVGIGLGFYIGEHWYDFLDEWDYDNRAVVSFSLGMIFDINFIHQGMFGIGIQPEILYTYTGGGFTIDNIDYDDDFWEDYYHTIQIPIFLKLRFGRTKGHFYLLGGPDFLISIDERAHVRHEGGDGSWADFRQKLYRKWVMGVSFGLGYDFISQGGKLGFMLTYSTYFQGFQNRAEYNNTLSLGVTFAFTVLRTGNKE